MEQVHIALFGQICQGAFSSTNQDIDSLLAGTYYVLVTDTNGCTANDTVTLLPGLEILANAGPEDTLVCFGDSLILTGTSSGAINPSISWNLLGTAVSSNSTLNYTFDDSATIFMILYLLFQSRLVLFKTQLR